MEGLAIGGGVNVFRCVFEEIERRTGRRRFCPGLLRNVLRLRHQHDHANAALPRNGQRLVQAQLMLRVHYAGCFNRIHVRRYNGLQMSLNQVRMRQLKKREPTPGSPPTIARGGRTTEKGN